MIGDRASSKSRAAFSFSSGERERSFHSEYNEDREGWSISERHKGLHVSAAQSCLTA